MRKQKKFYEAVDPPRGGDTQAPKICDADVTKFWENQSKWGKLGKRRSGGAPSRTGV